MELHSHTHAPRKKWTHYLWEILKWNIIWNEPRNIDCKNSKRISFVQLRKKDNKQTKTLVKKEHYSNPQSQP